MSKSDWIATLGSFGLILFTGLVAVLVSDWNAGRGVFEYHHPKYEQGRAANTYCNPSAYPLSLGETAGPNDKGDASSENPEQKYYDLCQQWRMAKAAERAATYAGLQTLLAFLSVLFLIVATIAAIFAAHYANDAAEAGRRNAHEAARSADAAQKALILTHKMSERQLRAYIGVIGGDIRLVDLNEGGQGVAVSIDLRNAGQTPAYNLTSWLRPPVILDKDAVPFGPPIPIEERRGSSIVPPQTNVHLNWVLPIGDNIAAMRSGSLRVFIWGGVDYKDAFHAPRHFIFRMVSGDYVEKHSGWAGWPLQPHTAGYDAN